MHFRKSKSVFWLLALVGVVLLGAPAALPAGESPVERPSASPPPPEEMPGGRVFDAPTAEEKAGQPDTGGASEPTAENGSAGTADADGGGAGGSPPETSTGGPSRRTFSGVQRDGRKPAGAPGGDLPPLDRPWILKFHEKKVPAGVNPTPEIQWADEQQEEACTALLHRMQSDYRNARYYSIRGDTCNTARFSGRFLESVRDSERRCPEGFLGDAGFGSEAVKNVGTLLELGARRCLETDPGLKPPAESRGIPNPKPAGQTAPSDSKKEVP